MLVEYLLAESQSRLSVQAYLQPYGLSPLVLQVEPTVERREKKPCKPHHLKDQMTLKSRSLIYPYYESLYGI